MCSLRPLFTSVMLPLDVGKENVGPRSDSLVMSTVPGRKRSFILKFSVLKSRPYKIRSV